jgi:hypothetical protein
MSISACSWVINPVRPEHLDKAFIVVRVLQGIFQKSVVLAACLRVALDARAKAKLPALTFKDLSNLLGNLSGVQASSTEKLVEDAAVVIAHCCALEAMAVSQSLGAALAHGSLALQAEAVELMQIVQAMLVFGPCDGFNVVADKFDAPTHPPQWAQAIMQPAVRLSLHALVGEVAHALARVDGVAEAVYAPFLEKLF